jgi:hypothetical protein
LEPKLPIVPFNEGRAWVGLNPAVLRWEAREAATRKSFQAAYEFGRQGMKPVVFPDEQQLSEEQCRYALIRDHTDLVAAFNLCSILRSEERWPEALQILEVLGRGPNCPGYFRVMQAEILASQNEWRGAWGAIRFEVAK